ncbi:hypothetical protein LLEC1_07824 [Akanthomyces lecanii]|uniref:EKC/KEOPS complex subunit BUD32 n=1 Tax=Cordyceps confragosa TaxID=2714763 RepID=A0A179IJH2_CORDF|nr:hypothetical protein LLEC1_07824 [Akanthomyces lecanii]
MLGHLANWFFRVIAAQYGRAATFFRQLLDRLGRTTLFASWPLANWPLTKSAPPRSHVCPRKLKYHRRPGPWRRSLLPALPDQAFAIPTTVPHGEVYYLSKGEFVGAGATSFVDRLPSGDIIKYPKPNPYCPEKENVCRQQMQTEAEAYRRIGNSARVPKLMAWDASACSLVLQHLANGNLQSYLERHGETVTSDQRRLWIRHAAEALAAVHSASIIHCDVTPRNFMLDRALDLYIADFAGSSVSGSPATITTSPRFQRPGWRWEPAYADDLFALGSVLYYIETGSEPYPDTREEEVQARFKAADFPDVSALSCGSIIHRCWAGTWDNAQQITVSAPEPGYS